jgi:hypothetical protein
MQKVVRSRQTTKEILLALLAAYEADVELHCIRIGSGGERVFELSVDFPSLCFDIVNVQTDAGRYVMRLVLAHRQLLRQVLQGPGEPGPISSARWALRDAVAALRGKLA